jgi:hypothetical protein
VQIQRLVPLPPGVADPRVLVDHEVADTQMREPRRDLHAPLPRPDDQHLRVLVRKLALPPPLLEPVPADVPKVAAGPDALGEALEALELRRDRDGAPAAVAGVHEPRDAAAGRDGRLEREVEHDPREVGVRLLERGLREREAAEAGRGEAVVQERGDLGQAVERADVPREREVVPPPGGVVEQGGEDPGDVACGDEVRKGLDPLRGYGRGIDIFGRGRAEVVKRGERCVNGHEGESRVRDLDRCAECSRIMQTSSGVSSRQWYPGFRARFIASRTIRGDKD